MSIIVRDSEGRVTDVSNDLKKKVQIGSRISDSEANDLTSQKTSQNKKKVATKKNNSSSFSSQESIPSSPSRYYINRDTGDVYDSHTQTLTTKDGSSSVVTSTADREILKNPALSAISSGTHDHVASSYLSSSRHSQSSVPSPSSREVKPSSSEVANVNTPTGKTTREVISRLNSMAVTASTSSPTPQNLSRSSSAFGLNTYSNMQNEVASQQQSTFRSLPSDVRESKIRQTQSELKRESAILNIEERYLANRSKEVQNTSFVSDEKRVQNQKQLASKINTLNEDINSFLGKTAKHLKNVKKANLLVDEHNRLVSLSNLSGSIEAVDTPSSWLSSQKYEDLGSEYEQKRELSRMTQSRTGSIFKTFKYSALSVGTGFASGALGFLELFSHYDFTKKNFKVPNLAVMGYKIATATPTQIGQFFKTIPAMAKSVGDDLLLRPTHNIGRFLGIKYTPKIISGALNQARDLYVKTGSNYYKQDTLFSSSVLSGKNKFPTVKSTAETKKLVEATKTQTKIKQIAPGIKTKSASYYKVITSSPKKISSKTVGIGGERSQLGKQDPGIYSTAYGEGSPYFLGLSDDVQYGFSLNPFKNIGVKNPTVTVFKVKNVKTYHIQVLNTPDFKSVQKFQKANIGKGNVYVTKRSMIGQGELPSKNYYDFSGRIIKHPGTSEHELVIGIGEKFKYTPQTTLGKLKGYDAYTTYNGRVVAIREAELLTSKATALNKLSSQKAVFGSKIISGKQILSESSALYNNMKYITPSTLARYSTLLPKTSPLKPSSLSVVSLSSPLSPYKSSFTGSISQVKNNYSSSGLSSSSFSSGSSRGSSSGGSSGSSSSGGSSRGSSSGGSSGSSSSGGSSRGSSSGGSSRGSSSGGSSGSGKKIKKKYMFEYEFVKNIRKKNQKDILKRWKKRNPWSDVSSVIKLRKIRGLKL